ncbi:unnamed protein product [Thelazia callipaeda]|uniref:Ig-like domain-containing protein n=1 Tax=Thelazia callipaeda TaxID=103827 RepID=A0A0N5CUM3_THECL|nr:unnamed protein product [Thelazia callipaeda]
MPATESMNPSSSIGANFKDLVDLEAVVINWAKQIFDVTKTKTEAKIKKKHLQYNINWYHLFNESLETVYTIGGVDAKNVKQSKEEQCLFKSTFTNTTEREQEYSFKTQRSTRSTATVIIEKGLSRGIEMALKLKVPSEILEANAGFHSELSIINVGENTIEEELVWSVDGTVHVPPLCETIAELVILEDHQTRSSFSTESRMFGRIIVTVTHVNDNNSLVTVIEGKIADIIRSLPNHSAMGFRIESDVVSYVTKGTCKFKYGVEQKVKITEHRIK